MGQEKNVEALHFNKVPLHITSTDSATYSLEKDEITVRIPLTSSDGHITVKLQPADQMFGMIVSVALLVKATSNVLVKLPDYAATLLATLDTSGDDVLLYSDGFEWHPIGGTYT